MMVKIMPSFANGTVWAPPSKSMAHRALLCGALSSGSVVRSVAYSRDIAATIGCLQALGGAVSQEKDVVRLGKCDPFTAKENTTLFCDESGSTLRFFLPLCMLSGKKITLTGSKRLFERPLGVYAQIAKQQGIFWQQDDTGVTVCGQMKSGAYQVPGDVSSQFITGLLYALPLLRGDSTLEVTGNFESASYVDLTLAALADFGVNIRREGRMFHIPGGQKFQPRDYTVEADCSNGAFLDGLNLLGGQVEVKGIEPNTLQGDRVYRQMYEKFSEENPQFDLSDCPDLGPVMFALAAAKGGATFTGTARLRIKESDRAAAMAQELAKFGIRIVVNENSVVVEKGKLLMPRESLWGHNDHRIVMALALLCTVTGGEIQGAEAVNKSFPDFFQKLRDLQVGVTQL